MLIALFTLAFASSSEWTYQTQHSVSFSESGSMAVITLLSSDGPGSRLPIPGEPVELQGRLMFGGAWQEWSEVLVAHEGLDGLSEISFSIPDIAYLDESQTRYSSVVSIRLSWTGGQPADVGLKAIWASGGSAAPTLSADTSEAISPNDRHSTAVRLGIPPAALVILPPTIQHPTAEIPDDSADLLTAAGGVR